MHISPINKPRVFITMGDPAGIGPEVIAKSMASPEVKGLAIFILVGDLGVLKNALNVFGDAGSFLHPVRGLSDLRDESDLINVVDPAPELKNSLPGKPTLEGAEKALKAIDTAIRLIKDDRDKTSVLVTSPVSKERIAEISPGFVGHTEYLHKAFSAELVTMVMTSANMCVVPVTRHIPLRDVAECLTGEYLVKTLMQVVEGRKLITGKDDVRIAVAALNPHAGEGGRIGTEEKELILPAVEKVKKIFPDICGPIPADIAFYKAVKKEYDIVVSMYHDQCLAPFKMIDFDSGVNVTLGLGHIRTSPDHGTAFNIAGKGMASSRSMEEAIKLAIRGISGHSLEC